MNRGPSMFQLAAGLDENGDYLDGTGEQEAKFLTGASPHQRKVYETLKREHGQWRYQRSKLPPEHRGPMMRVGERPCRYCGTFFEPKTLKQWYDRPACRKLHWRNRRGEVLTPLDSQTTSQTPHGDAADTVTGAVDSPRICAYCGRTFTPKRSTKRHCSDRCRQAAYRARAA